MIDMVGIIGGFTISFSLLPQVIKTWMTKSADDISYAYQGVYILGCTLVNTYAVSENLWPVFVPCLFEEFLIVSLTLMKVMFALQMSKQQQQPVVVEAKDSNASCCNQRAIRAKTTRMDIDDTTETECRTKLFISRCLYFMFNRLSY
jgi:MtN3 and saliva related transmembrane protein